MANRRTIPPIDNKIPSDTYRPPVRLQKVTWLASITIEEDLVHTCRVHEY
jgi:hypothetical protein